MKKTLSVILSILLVLPVLFCACSKTNNSGKDVKIGVVYKQADNAYFKASIQGFEKAAEELKFTLIHSGPQDGSVDGQKKIIREYIEQGVNVLCISANDSAGLVDVCKEAKEKGIKILSFDSKVDAEGRDLNIQPATPELIGTTQLEFIAKEMNYEGKLAIVSSSTSSPNQNLWISYIENALNNNETYKNVELAEIVYGEDDYTKSYDVCKDLLENHPDLKGIIVPSTVASPAVAKCITDEGKQEQVKMTGLSLAEDMAEYIRSGVAPATFLWDPIELGYCSAYIGVAMANGKLTATNGAEISVPETGTLYVSKTDDDGGLSVYLNSLKKFDATTVDEQ